MDENVLATALFTYIQANFSGGIKAFYKEGGNFMIDPVIEKRVYIYHPNFPERLKQDLLNEPNFTFKFIDKPNYEGLNDNEIEEHLWDITMKIYKRYHIYDMLIESRNNIALFISIKDSLEERDIESIANSFLAISPKLLRGFIYCNEQIYPFGNFDNTDKPTTNILKDKERVIKVVEFFDHSKQENRIVTDDDFLNAKIDIHRDLDVLDIIAKL